MRDVRRFSRLALALLALGGCGGQQMIGGSPDAALSNKNYPPGPYGISVGSIVAPMTFADGWIVNPLNGDNATDANKQEVDMTRFYQSPTVHWLLMDVSAGWCVPCQSEQTDLLNYSDPTNAKWGGHHIGVFEALVQNDNETSPSVPGATFMEKWINSFNLDFAVVGDDFMPQQAMPFVTSGFPTNVLIDTSTMKIVWRLDGYSPTDVESELCATAGCN